MGQKEDERRYPEEETHNACRDVPTVDKSVDPEADCAALHRDEQQPDAAEFSHRKGPTWTPQPRE